MFTHTVTFFLVTELAQGGRTFGQLFFATYQNWY